MPEIPDHTPGRPSEKSIFDAVFFRGEISSNERITSVPVETLIQIPDLGGLAEDPENPRRTLQAFLAEISETPSTNLLDIQAGKLSTALEFGETVRKQKLEKIYRCAGKTAHRLSGEEMKKLNEEGEHDKYYKQSTEALKLKPRRPEYFAFSGIASELVVPGSLCFNPEDLQQLRKFVYELFKFIVMYDDLLDEKDFLQEHPSFSNIFVSEMRDYLHRLSSDPDSPITDVNHEGLTEEQRNYIYATKHWLYMAFQKVKHIAGLKDHQVRKFIEEAFDTFLQSCLYGDEVNLTAMQNISDLPEFADYMKKAEASASTPCMMAVAAALKPEWVEHYKVLSHHVAVLVRLINEMYGVEKDLIDGSANAVIFEALKEKELSLGDLSDVRFYSDAVNIPELRETLEEKLLPQAQLAMKKMTKFALNKFMRPKSRAVQTIVRAVEDELIRMHDAIRNMPVAMNAESYLERILSFIPQYFKLCSPEIREIWFQALGPELGQKLRGYFEKL